MTKKKKKKQRHPILVELISEFKGIFILALCGLIFWSLISFAYEDLKQNGIGLVGFTIGWLFHALFGLSSYVWALFVLWVGWRLAWAKTLNHIYLKLLYVSILCTSLSMLLTVVEVHLPTLANFIYSVSYPHLAKSRLYFHLGGAPFYFLYQDLPLFRLNTILNAAGVTVLFSFLTIVSLLCLGKITPRQIASKSLKIGYTLNFIPWLKKRLKPTTRTVALTTSQTSYEPLEIEPEIEIETRPRVSKKQTEEPVPQKQKKPLHPTKSETSPFNLPAVSMLRTPKKVDQSSLKKDLKKRAELLEETLLSFGIEAKVGHINCGPTITSFEVNPSIGVKVQKIKALESDIALNLEAKSIRIIAPIPGKAAVGIEIPNPDPQEVGFKELLQTYLQGNKRLKIPLLLGKAVNGDPVMSDLTKMPHCIIAGATGSGKSVCINTIVMSILMTAKPDEIRLIMIDPKKVELTPYNRLPHLLAPVITEPQGACAALKWLVKEMENRYDILKVTGNRNIDSFNHRNIDKEAEEMAGREIPEKLPYIVGIIDELADLMMVSSSDIETPIARIAQMARAVGIHLILATQRPSREVITGLIKANFPTRISFKVSSRINSQIILDEVGAETLLGNGDMLFLPPGTSTLIRAQGAYLPDNDINAIVATICEQSPPNYVIDSFDQMNSFGFDLDGNDPDEDIDPLYEEAKEVILSTGNASTTFLQRKLKIGYARAASLIDILEARGIVGPAEGSKARKILLKKFPTDDDLDP